jgi:hypothetical protein
LLIGLRRSEWNPLLMEPDALRLSGKSSKVAP